MSMNNRMVNRMVIEKIPDPRFRVDRYLRPAVAWTVLFALMLSANAEESSLNESTLRFENATGAACVDLVGADARVQLIVSRTLPNGLVADHTREVKYDSVPVADLQGADSQGADHQGGRVQIDSTGLVTPIADGAVEVIATDQDGQSARVVLNVSGTQQTPTVSFCGQVVPIFTKLGCNGGGCHGKIAGQNGFRLSLLGFEPREDHKRLVVESRSRRVSIAAPDRSLLLLKTINAMPHGGGARTSPDSHEYRVLRRWISQGMPFDAGEVPQVTQIQAVPNIRRMVGGSAQQLSIIATFSDGSVQDVTRAAVYESNDTEMAEVSETGLVQTAEVVGDVAVMARYQGNVTVFRAEIPLRVATPNQLAHSASDRTSAEPITPTPANVIDHLVHAKLDSLGIPISQPCDDATYLRRLTLDLTGRIPTLDETDQFLGDPAQDKRQLLLERLLASDDYANFFARKWSVILRNRRSGGALEVSNMLFHHWLIESFRTNKAYDQFADELLTASGTVFSNPATAWLAQVTDQNERVEDISQLFLGQRIQCARCHHHPYEKWSQEDYARMSAFFSTITKKTQGNDVTFVTRIATPAASHPKTGQSVAPAGLDAPPLSIDATVDPRSQLSRWVTSHENPFFAKSLVNRYWKHFMGRGLVEPEDDLRVTNPPSNPELLDAMAAHFIESGYDLHALIRLICSSETYSASSDANPDNVIDRRSHSRFYPKRLQAETLLDAIDAVAGSQTAFAGMPAGTRAVELPDTGFDSYFLSVFGQPDSKTACECERSFEANLAQSLHLLNSEEMQNKLSGAQGRAALLANDSTRSVETRIRELYRITLSREPSADDLETSLSYLNGRDNQQQPWEDLIWALVNSKEFLFNH